MGLFKKRESDIIDLTKLQERGVLQRSQEIEKAKSAEKDVDFIDLGTSFSGADNSSSDTNNGADALGLLTGLASAGESGNSNTGSVSESNYGEAASEDDSAKMSEIKIKMEDIEYKLDRFMKRLEKIEEKLNE